MYERFYQLRERPFALSPDPDYLYPSRVHREALDYIRFGIEGYAGFVVITGEIGSGKTTLLQVLLRGLDGQTTVVRLVNTLLTGRELIESLLIDLGVADPPPTKPLMLRELAARLVEHRTAGRRVVAVIDEAQNLSLEALEELRMLSNLETEKSKLIQIVLVGQPDLRDTLDRPSLEQLRQRVTVRYHIEPLDEEETARYVNHRLARAATGAPLTFPRNVTDAIHARSRGVPRMINVICDGVLLCGYADESPVIDLALVRTAIEELESSTVLRTTDGPRLVPPPPAREPVAQTPRPAPAAPLDLPLRDADRRRTLGTVDRPATAVATRTVPTSTEPPSLVASPAPIRTTGAPATVATVRVRPAPPAAAYAAGLRPASTWSWLKEALFGSAPEVERR
jgi:putative secretion ATPase (PEP-CTERM system associated)